ncbi:hypothetical protein RSOLAG22IIIB_07936 [Rhizoctonia solani]|uniref:Uncharacterized protein n=1 Tax=Rhizoctonia solani TaxID=456999 RepID=A0A0K6FQR5_9AGAM|nr:hypothetical protein RSOLAG22IIIB_07936 [Rhizoctonia solani]
MPEHLQVRYYACINSGTGLVIYPQIRDARRSMTGVLWDGRNHLGSGLGYMIPDGGHKLVDLSETGMKEDDLFMLGSSTAFGPDQYTNKHVFKYNPNATTMVIATRTGELDRGALHYTGERRYTAEQYQLESTANNNYEMAMRYPQALISFAAVEHVLGQLDALITKTSEAAWKGMVEWRNPAVITLGIGSIALCLAHHGYQVLYFTKGNATDIWFRPGKRLGDSDEADRDSEVPPEVIANWEAAVERAVKYSVDNRGITFAGNLV